MIDVASDQKNAETAFDIRESCNDFHPLLAFMQKL
jgi:hypothetical protein